MRLLPHSLIVVTILLFQTHWIDDVFSGQPDPAGVAVSAIGSVLMVGGYGFRRYGVGRTMLGAGLVFVALVSLADLTGVRPDGSLTSALLHHLRFELGVSLATAVAANLVCAVLLLRRVLSGRY
jgi:hypothetical protein